VAVAIVGGGIAGLSAAIGLRQQGVDATIYERATDVAASQLGAGLGLAYNATRVLRKLGLLDQVLEVGWRTDRFEFCDARGRLLSGWEVAEGEVQLGITRKALHELLVRAAGPDALAAGKTCTAFSDQDGSVNATFDDGTAVETNLLLGADGLRSVVRAQLHGEQAPRYAGFSVLRSVVPATEENPPLTPGIVRLFWGPGASFGMYHVGPGIVYIFGWRKGPEGEHVERGQRKQEWLHRYREWSPEINALIERTEEESIHQTDIFDRPPVERWGRGRVSLVGDAAHAMTFNMGQGACQAFEDTAQLTRAVAGHGETPEALRAYEDGRKERADQYTKASARASNLSVMGNPLGWRLRNLVLRAAAKRVSKGEEMLKIEV
jgi:2-polyprenyl-6-methoxyphenol hydroxylase-like FAD-dependent oxidoreductase